MNINSTFSQSEKSSIDSLSSIKDWHSLSYKDRIQSTCFDLISLKITTRYMAGRTKKVPVFCVSLESGSVDIPIPSMGWKKAWKKALLTVSSSSGSINRNSVIRYLNRPPRISDYLVKEAA